MRLLGLIKRHPRTMTPSLLNQSQRAPMNTLQRSSLPTTAPTLDRTLDRTPGWKREWADDNYNPPPPIVEPDAASGSTDIRYAQCWEDADVLLEGLGVQPGDTCLSIASAGENTLALLTRHPANVIAIDASRAQLYSLALRVAAYRCLDHEGLLELIGSVPSTRQSDLYAACRGSLDGDARTFWDSRPHLIEQGIGAAGRFERYLRWFRQFALPLCHTPDRVERLLAPCSKAERNAFFSTTWNSWGWRFLIRLFSSRTLVSRLGRDPRFFGQVTGDVAARMTERVTYALTALDPSENPYLQWILTGEHRTALPLALRPEHFDTIRKNLDRLSWHETSLESFLSAQRAHSIDRFNLSNLFEYVPEAHYHALLRALWRTGRRGGRLAYWNLFVDRQRPEVLAHRLRPLTEQANALHAHDKAFFYRRFVLDEIR